MSIYHKDQEKCSNAKINEFSGICDYSWWHGNVCYCTHDPENKLKGLLRCPYAWRNYPDSNCLEGDKP